jgi:hypothetical protein
MHPNPPSFGGLFGVWRMTALTRWSSRCRPVIGVIYLARHTTERKVHDAAPKARLAPCGHIVTGLPLHDQGTCHCVAVPVAAAAQVVSAQCLMKRHVPPPHDGHPSDPNAPRRQTVSYPHDAPALRRSSRRETQVKPRRVVAVRR